MSSQVPVVTGQISVDGLLSRADRLFRNDDDGVWVEILQNSRRAGATVVNVAIEETGPEHDSCTITVHDNGSGIENFQDLLTLGSSGWDAEIQAIEDPAGMGFFALCRSDVEVQSGSRSVAITPSVFLGKAQAVVHPLTEEIPGTRIRFSRQSSRTQLTSALQRTAEFCPVEVRLDGASLERHDFLDGALYRETIDGIEVGFSTAFRWSRSYTDANWNFYGARIRANEMSFTGLLLPGRTNPETISARFNVLQTGRIKLQLPDRKGIIEDEFYKEFLLKARAAAYRLFRERERHALPFSNWAEAKTLGVTLPEAAPLLRRWHAAPKDDYEEPVFGTPKLMLVPDDVNALLIGEDLEHAHTIEGALESGAVINGELFAENPEFAGYTWYDRLPVIVQCIVSIDGVPYENCKQLDVRPKKIELDLTIVQSGIERHLQLPALLHVDGNSCAWDEVCFVAVEQSPWDNSDLEGPFSVLDFIVAATFCPSDDPDADSRSTQRDRYEEEVRRAVNAYFRGPRATLLAILHEALEYQARALADELGVKEIRFKRPGGARQWNVELLDAPKE